MPDPQPIDTGEVTWTVLTVDGVAWFAVTAAGYEALSSNVAESLRWVREAKWRLDYYRCAE